MREFCYSRIETNAFGVRCIGPAYICINVRPPAFATQAMFEDTIGEMSDGMNPWSRLGISSDLL